jgi:pyridoxamine 5'-phosphate oxidase
LTIRTVFQLATVAEEVSIDEALRALPHVRSHAFRSFIAEPAFADKPLLMTTTDIRTPKVYHIRANSRVEVVWWISATNEQFRIAGRAIVIPSPAHTYSDGDHHGKIFEGSSLALRTPNFNDYDFGRGGALADFDWERKRIEAFDLMSGRMKASWCRPTPGTPLTEDPTTWPETLPKLDEANSNAEKQNLRTALANFALLLIDPYYVDYVELGVMPHRRTGFEFGPDGWKETALVP